MAWMTRDRARGAAPPLQHYLAEIDRHALLTVEEERAFARRFRDLGDGRAAHALVTANLRFVVSIARQYRSHGFRIADLVQEGNIGLMRAVQKFDPERGIRLITYAAWWIRAHIHDHIVRSWSLVRLGTTQNQRRLFLSLSRASRELDARDLSLDAPVGDDTGRSQLDLVPGADPRPDDALAGAEEQALVAGRVEKALARLDPRERYIVEKRVMGERPMTLGEIGAHLGFSRERARQIEVRARTKLRLELEQLATEIGWPLRGLHEREGAR